MYVYMCFNELLKLVAFIEEYLQIIPFLKVIRKLFA